MPDLSRSELAAYAACVVLVVLLGWRVLRADGEAAPAPVQRRAVARRRPRRSTAPSVSVAPARDGSATVHVVGAVRRPGVYRLRLGQRVEDAIRRAGGARDSTDLQAINLAAKVADGQQVVVPRRAAAGGSGAAAGGGGPSAASRAQARAQRVLRRRRPSTSTRRPPSSSTRSTASGPPRRRRSSSTARSTAASGSLDDLAQVSGIGPKKLEALKAQVTV